MEKHFLYVRAVVCKTPDSYRVCATYRGLFRNVLEGKRNHSEPSSVKGFWLTIFLLSRADVRPNNTHLPNLHSDIEIPFVSLQKVRMTYKNIIENI